MDSVSSKKIHAIGMPQMYWGGISENWLLKELGDIHWSLISKGLKVNSDQLVDSNNNRLYASFVRLRWEGSENLLSFKENQKLSFSSELSRYGSKMFFSNGEFSCEDKKVSFNLMSVFSSREGGDNKTLKKGTPLTPDNSKIFIHDKLPTFAKEYLESKEEFYHSTDKLKTMELNLNGETFGMESQSIFSCEYTIEPYSDINGVGLLYFASYPNISDKCERLYFQKYNKDNLKDWAENSSSISRDVWYFGNANAGDVLIYKIDETEFIGDKKIQIASSLFRKSDNKIIAKIFVIKSFSEPVKLGKELDDIPEDKNLLGKEELNKIIQDFLNNILELSNIKFDTNLNKIGIGSIIYMELSEFLNNEYQLNTNPSSFFGIKTIDELSSLVLMNMGYLKTEKTPRTVLLMNGRPDKEIAIIGTSFKLPKSDTDEELWNLLINGETAVSKAPEGRISWPSWVNLDNQHRGIEKGAYIDNIDKFAASFFNISPREAELIDPQQRLLLEGVWRLFENSGYKVSSMAESQ